VLEVQPAESLPGIHSQFILTDVFKHLGRLPIGISGLFEFFHTLENVAKVSQCLGLPFYVFQGFEQRQRFIQRGFSRIELAHFAPGHAQVVQYFGDFVFLPRCFSHFTCLFEDLAGFLIPPGTKMLYS
jgi:hypothetical protein